MIIEILLVTLLAFPFLCLPILFAIRILYTRRTLSTLELPACTRCTYDLTGLPLIGACPECGTHYRRSTSRATVWAIHGPWARRVPLIALIGLVFAAATELLKVPFAYCNSVFYLSLNSENAMRNALRMASTDTQTVGLATLVQTYFVSIIGTRVTLRECLSLCAFAFTASLLVVLTPPLLPGWRTEGLAIFYRESRGKARLLGCAAGIVIWCLCHHRAVVRACRETFQRSVRPIDATQRNQQ